MVGVAGFEPAAHWSQTSCATKLRYTPLKWQGQKGSNPRHAVLETAALPTELCPYIIVAEKMGFEPMRPLTNPNGLANRPLQPLEYFSRLMLLGGEGGIRTHGPFQDHWFSRPAP